MALALMTAVDADGDVGALLADLSRQAFELDGPTLMELLAALLPFVAIASGEAPQAVADVLFKEAPTAEQWRELEPSLLALGG